MSTILTGLQANGVLHIGNYIGALKPMVNIQQNLSDEDRFCLFVPDLHTLTTPVDYDSQYENTLRNVRIYIAAGINPSNAQTLLYRQSYISAHSELAWLMQCFTYFGEASRMTEFKDKSTRKGNESFSAGLFTYPMLQAADILLYNADYIPVGEDQKQHIELTKTLAERFNNKFDEVFTIPEPWKEQLAFTNRDKSAKIYSLTNPEKKMSKSVVDPKGTINLLESPEEAAKKVMGAETDSVGVINYDPENQPGISNLMQIESSLSDRELADVIAEWTGKERYGDFKKQVAESVNNFLLDFQEKYNKVNNDEVLELLTSGEARATEIANSTLLKAQKAVGLRR